MSDKELIDPLNPDTYDERVIVQSGIRASYTGISQAKWEQAFGWKIRFTYYLSDKYYWRHR